MESQNNSSTPRKTGRKGAYLGEVQSFTMLFILAVIAFLLPFDQMTAQVKTLVQVGVIGSMMAIVALYIKKR